jgi:hypothetical protein
VQRTTGCAVALLFLCLLVPSLAPAATWYVPDHFGTVAEAVDRAASGDNIVLRAGTHAVDNVSYRNKAITIRSENPADPEVVALTVLAGVPSADPMIRFESGEGASSVLRGVTVRDARAGAISIRYSSPTIDNCVFRSNVSPYSGGAIDTHFSDAKVTNCQFYDNKAAIGGAIHLNGGAPTVFNGYFEGNRGPDEGTAAYGGAISVEFAKATLEQCTFVGNSTIAPIPISGGAISVVTYPRTTTVVPVVNRCYFLGNGVPGVQGSAIYIDQGPMRILNSLFAGSRGWSWSGVVESSYRNSDSHVLTNCTFYGNQGVPAFKAPTFTGNPAPGISTFTNCLFWGNDLLDFYGPVQTLIHCDVQRLPAEYVGKDNNISLEPKFVNTAGSFPAWDLRLAPGSPCIDSGTESTDPMQKYDLDNVLRPRDGNGDLVAVSDIGCYEAWKSTIVITKGLMDYVADTLVVNATSAFGSGAALAVPGLGSLNWNSKASRWERTFTGVTAAPAKLTVCGAKDACVSK